MKIKINDFITQRFVKKIEENSGKFKILWQNNKIAEVPTR